MKLLGCPECPNSTTAVHATHVNPTDIDLLALRVRRRRPGMPNVLSRLPRAAISLGLSRAPLQPNGFMSGTRVRLPERREFAERQQQVIRALHGNDEGPR